MPRGRPRKYQNPDEVEEAARRLRQQRYQRQRQAQAPPEFVHYEPTPQGVPATTCPDLGLRISADVPIPRDPLLQPDELQEGEDSYRPASPLASLAVDDVEAAAVLSQLQASDKEQTNERIEYEQRILQQIKGKDARTAGILLEMQAGTAQGRTGADEIPEDLGNTQGLAGVDSDRINTVVDQSHPIKNNSIQRWSTVAATWELAAAVQPLIANTRSVSNTSTPTPAKAANIPVEALNSAQTPSQRSASPARSSSQRKTFPAQSNTLLSWVRPVSRQPSGNSNTPQPAQLSSRHSTPLPLPPPSNHSTPRLLQPSSSRSTP